MLDEFQLISGIDVPILELGITLHQPRLKEIAMLGEQQYFLALSIFKMTKDALKINKENVTNWQILQEALGQKIEGVDNPRVLITNFLQLFLISKLTLGPKSIIIETTEGFQNVEPEQFDIFQKTISEIGGASLLTPAQEEFKPRNKRAAEIAEKMKKARARLAAQQPQSKSSSFIAKYIKIVGIGTSNSFNDIMNMTILQLNDLTQMYLSWESYDLEVKSRLAGGKSDDKLIHWTMRGNQNDSIETI